jgi:hypothetical protein
VHASRQQLCSLVVIPLAAYRTLFESPKVRNRSGGWERPTGFFLGHSRRGRFPTVTLLSYPKGQTKTEIPGWLDLGPKPCPRWSRKTGKSTNTCFTTFAYQYVEDPKIVSRFVFGLQLFELSSVVFTFDKHVF